MKNRNTSCEVKKRTTSHRHSEVKETTWEKWLSRITVLVRYKTTVQLFGKVW